MIHKKMENLGWTIAPGTPSQILFHQTNHLTALPCSGQHLLIVEPEISSSDFHRKKIHTFKISTISWVFPAGKVKERLETLALIILQNHCSVSWEPREKPFLGHPAVVIVFTSAPELQCPDHILISELNISCHSCSCSLSHGFLISILKREDFPWEDAGGWCEVHPKKPGTLLCVL